MSPQSTNTSRRAISSCQDLHTSVQRLPECLLQAQASMWVLSTNSYRWPAPGCDLHVKLQSTIAYGVPAPGQDLHESPQPTNASGGPAPCKTFWMSTPDYFLGCDHRSHPQLTRTTYFRPSVLPLLWDPKEQSLPLGVDGCWRKEKNGCILLGSFLTVCYLSIFGKTFF